MRPNLRESVAVSDLAWQSQPPLRRPLLLMAFKGLFDAAEAATDSLAWIRDRTESTEIAQIDPEEYFNFQEARPIVRKNDEGERTLTWPVTKVHACQTDDIRDLVIMTGMEPHLRWRTYADQIVEVARRSGAEMVITVGAMVSMVPHSRPLGVTGSAADVELAERLSLDKPSYQGPTGVVGVINQRLHEVGIPVISLRVAVPHYVPSAPNPKATRALLRRIQQTTRVQTHYEELDAAVSEWVQRMDVAVASDTESADYVSRLENQVDSTEELLPSGDDLAAELEAFLRDRPGAQAESSSAELDERSEDGSSDETTDESGDDPAD